MVPKAIRSAAELAARRVIDIEFSGGWIEIEFLPMQARVENDGRVPRIVPDEDLPALSDQEIRDTAEATRR